MGKLVKLPTQESKLVKQCKRGNQAAQRELYERFAPQMLSVCRRYVKTTEDAEEVLSNAFIKVFRKIDQFSGKGPLGGWIRRIMVNESLNYIRYQKNLFVEIEEENHREVAHEQLQEKIDSDYLLQLISELPLGYRTVFNLFALEGYGHKEIAEKLGISENTSKSQLSKARQQLQQKLQNNELLYREK